ncbi:Rad52/Rad22 family DNA repair protein [Lachnospira multipara]|uniref:Rad52/Rad22 family DNA repair protein n=1 Tax=Lachnospira multipara TaxID=28051 RepID=UPI00041FC9B4|nr:Rad52/Rad22 family DNA repair protein [Lachnospira multipara]
MNLCFRNLRADEIEVRVHSLNKGGAQLLLYKDARADMNILDDAVGPLGWKKEYKRDNANCVVSILDKDTGEWISKEDTGTASNSQAEKGLASDSFKRACVNWGIGRALYDAPYIFITKDKLPTFKEANGKFTSYERFKIANVVYSENNKSIIEVAINIISNYKVVSTVVFKQSKAAVSNVQPLPSTTPTINTNTRNMNSNPVHVEESQSTPRSNPTPVNADVMDDEDIILFGPCKGSTFGEIKNTDRFNTLMNWVKGQSFGYGGEKDEQLKKLKALA